jgi:hypothetical protein
MPLRRLMARSILATLTTAIMIFAIRESMEINLARLVLLAILFGIIYAILIFVTKSLDENDLMILKNLKRKIFRN